MDLVSTSFALGLIRAEMNVHSYTYFHVPSVIKLKNDHPDLSNCAKITCFLNWIILGRSVQNKQDRKHWRLKRFNTNTNVILESQNNLWQCHIFLGMSMLVNKKKKKKKIPFSFRKEVWIMDPNTDTYYYWLCTIAIPVFYNLMLLPARYEFMAFCISLFALQLFRCHYHGFASL